MTRTSHPRPKVLPKHLILDLMADPTRKLRRLTAEDLARLDASPPEAAPPGCAPPGDLIIE